MTTRIRLALASLAAAGIAVSGAGVAAAQEAAPEPAPASGSLTGGPLADLLAPLAETKTKTFGTDVSGQSLCEKWKAHDEMYPFSGNFDYSDCQQDDLGEWFITYKTWPQWLLDLESGSLG